VCGARGAGAEVGEDPVDHRRLRDAGDDAHRAVARFSAATGQILAFLVAERLTERLEANLSSSRDIMSS